MPGFSIGTGSIALADFAAAALEPATVVEVTEEAWQQIRDSRDLVDAAAAAGQPVYGLNTLLGSGRNTPVEASKILAFQVQLVRYHASGIGEFLAAGQTRAVLLSRLIGFARGGSGVRAETVEFYRQLLNQGILPAIPRTGSVGSSDLTALAAVASVAIGEGQAHDQAGNLVAGAEALAGAGIEPLVLQGLEGLALVSANSYTVGVGVLQLAKLHRLVELADTALVLSLEAIGRLGGAAQLDAYSPIIAQAKGSRGLAESISRIQELLRGSWLAEPGRDGGVQDPLSFRSAPQTHGAVRAQTGILAAALQAELDGRGENPLVDVPSGRLVSGGNFQITELALALEGLRLGLAHLGHISERRIAKLFPAQRELRQARLAAAESTPEDDGFPGLLWYSAAALLAELKALAQPVTLGAPTLSADVEDHSTLAPLALQQLERSIELGVELLVIEALTAVYLLGPETLRSRPLGEAAGAIHQALSTLLDERLPAAELILRAGQLLWSRP